MGDTVTTTIRRQFVEQWQRYFPGAELPIVFSYSDEELAPSGSGTGKGSHCIICDLREVREGTTRHFSRRNLACGGARRYLGFETEMRPNFAHFLSCGIPGKVEGERYKRTPELVERFLKRQPSFEAPGPSITFKRWDQLDEKDTPQVVIFFATPDVLSGLFTLANFDQVDPQAVIAPFGSGCSSVVLYPYMELRSPQPRAVLGMFDISARPCVESNVLTFAVPWPRFTAMVDQMHESFLKTRAWGEVRDRL
jgi:hypothetical protein